MGGLGGGMGNNSMLGGGGSGGNFNNQGGLAPQGWCVIRTVSASSNPFSAFSILLSEDVE